MILDLLLAAGLLILILGSSKLLTDAYVRRAYYQCASCGSLNAKRRTECRVCGEPLPNGEPGRE